MKILVTLGTVDPVGFQKVRFEVEREVFPGYDAGVLRLTPGDAELIVRRLGGHSFGFVGECEVRMGEVE